MPKYLPKDIEWFIAELIQEFTFANGDNPLVWVNSILIKAGSLEQAYAQAHEKGKVYNDTYTNTDGVLVTCRFRGLRDLLLIYEPLEDGSEILWQEFDDLTPEQIDEMVTPKRDLGAFATHGPDLSDEGSQDEGAVMS